MKLEFIGGGMCRFLIDEPQKGFVHLDNGCSLPRWNRAGAGLGPESRARVQGWAHSKEVHCPMLLLPKVSQSLRSFLKYQIYQLENKPKTGSTD